MMSVDHGVRIKDEIVVCVLENPRKIFNPLMRGGNKRSYGQSGRNRMAFENGQSYPWGSQIAVKKNLELKAAGLFKYV